MKTLFYYFCTYGTKKVPFWTFSLWLYYDWLTPSQILIFSNLIMHNFILVSKRNSSVFKLFIFIGIRYARLKICEWTCVNIRYITLRKIPKAIPRTYIFQSGFLVGLYSLPLIFKHLNFQMRRLRRELVNELGVGTY